MKTISHNGYEFEYTPLTLSACQEIVDLEVKIEIEFQKFINEAEKSGLDFETADNWEREYNIYLKANAQRNELLKSETNPDKCLEIKELISKTENDIKNHLLKKTKQIDDILKLKERLRYSAIIKIISNVELIKPILQKCLKGDLSKIDYSDTFFIFQCLNNLFFYSEKIKN